MRDTVGLPTVELTRVPVVRLMPAAILQPRLRLVDGDQLITGSAFSMEAIVQEGASPNESVRANPIMRDKILQAFRYSRNQNNRFNAEGSAFGAYYAGTTLAASISEIRWHLENPEGDAPAFDRTRTYRAVTARASGTYLDMRAIGGAALDPDPAIGYPAGHRLAELVHGKVDGIYYPSTRDPKGACIAAFRPELLEDFRLGQLLAFESREIEGRRQWGYRPIIPAHLAQAREIA